MKKHACTIPLAVIVGLSVYVMACTAKENVPATQRSNPLLVTELKHLLERSDVIDATRQTPATAPSTSPPASGALTVDAIIERVRKDAPEIFELTGDEAKNFANGQYNDETASSRLEKSVEVLKDFKMEIPPVSKRLLELYQEKKLSGVSLELTARVFESHLRFLVSSISKDHARHALPI